MTRRSYIFLSGILSFCSALGQASCWIMEVHSGVSSLSLSSCPRSFCFPSTRGVKLPVWVITSYILNIFYSFSHLTLQPWSGQCRWTQCFPSLGSFWAPILLDDACFILSLVFHYRQSLLSQAQVTVPACLFSVWHHHSEPASSNRHSPLVCMRTKNTSVFPQMISVWCLMMWWTISF